ncbi:MAG: zinc ribbon domain-containing protein [Planctomycetota bacterium]|nr:zinc ribbon domain-containing protein [Planctomycetota bacterium]
MPTYEYRCTACRHEFEQFQSIKAPTLRTCPSCGKKALERLIGTGGAVIFKGSGFYQTDYRSESYREAAKKDAPPAATAADAPAPKPDSASAPAGASANGKGKPETSGTQGAAEKAPAKSPAAGSPSSSDAKSGSMSRARKKPARSGAKRTR